MELKEARELSKIWREQNDLWEGASYPVLSKPTIVAITLDDRITELEKEKDELVNAYATHLAREQSYTR